MADVLLRKAWTGGSVPSKADKNEEPFRLLRHIYFKEQVADSGGLDFWACAGTSALERARIFWNRATLDAWATLRP